MLLYTRQKSSTVENDATFFCCVPHSSSSLLPHSPLVLPLRYLFAALIPKTPRTVQLTLRLTSLPSPQTFSADIDDNCRFSASNVRRVENRGSLLTIPFSLNPLQNT